VLKRLRVQSWAEFSRAVKTGATVDGLVEISGDGRAGDRLIVRGGERVDAGQSVSVQPLAALALREFEAFDNAAKAKKKRKKQQEQAQAAAIQQEEARVAAQQAAVARAEVERKRAQLQAMIRDMNAAATLAGSAVRRIALLSKDPLVTAEEVDYATQQTTEWSAVTQEVQAGVRELDLGTLDSERQDQYLAEGSRALLTMQALRDRAGALSGQLAQAIEGRRAEDARIKAAIQQAQREVRLEMENNRLFKGGDLHWNGMIIKEDYDLYEYSTLTGLGDTSTVAPVFLCGAQAVGAAYAKRWTSKEQTFDYGDKRGVAIESIYGIDKMRFGTSAGSDTGTPKDHGVVTGFFASSTSGAADPCRTSTSPPLNPHPKHVFHFALHIFLRHFGHVESAMSRL